MLPLEVVFDVPPEIVRGIASGALERVGGVIRETGSKQVVMWLREGGQIADNSNLANGVLRSLLDVGSGGLTSVAFNTLDAVVAANRHNQIMQQFNSLTNLVGLVGGIAVVNLGVSVISLAVLVKRFRDIEKQLEGLYEELQKDRDDYLQAGLEAAQDAATAAFNGDAENKRDYALQAINRLRQARRPILDKATETQSSENVDLHLAYLSQAVQVDSVLVRCYLEIDDSANAKRHLNQALVDYRKRMKFAVNKLLGIHRAVYFHHTVTDEDLWRYVGIRKWLSDRDVELTFLLQEAMFADRHDFWNPAVVSEINGPEKRRSIRERLSPKAKSNLEMLPMHLLALAKSGMLIENFKRLDGLQTEIEAIERLGISSSDWEQQQEEALEMAKVNLEVHDDFVLLINQEWLAQQSDSFAA